HREEDRGALAPQPGLDQLAALLTASAAAGLRCEVRREGEEVELAPGLDLVAYRAIEGGLAIIGRRHGADALVALRWEGARLQVEVRGAGTGGGVDPDLASLRRRLALYGGTLEEIADPAGDFCLRARLPITERGTA